MLKAKYILIPMILLFMEGGFSFVFADGCEVTSYSVYEETQRTVSSCSGAVHYEKQQCVDATIRSVSSVGHHVKDFSIRVTFDNNRTATRRIKPSNPGDSETKIIGAGERYDVKLCFNIRPSIVKVECSLK